MPRMKRIKPVDVGTYFHLMNRVAGEVGEYPFGDIEKETFVSLLKEGCRFFTVELIAYQVMGNHWHAVCFAPAEVLDPASTADRYNAFYADRKAPLEPSDPDCLRIAENMRDISCFMRWVQQRFTTWFNKTRTRRRRGALWAGRFKSTILERETALWECLCYVEMNAVRAGLVADPADYRFGSWGEWCGTGKHPFAESLVKHLVAYEGTEAWSRTLESIQTRFRVDLARRRASEKGASPQEIAEAMDAARVAPSFSLSVNRRVRYWSDGLVIGGRTFVQETVAKVFGRKRAMAQRLKVAGGAGTQEICAFSRLHSLPS